MRNSDQKIGAAGRSRQARAWPTLLLMTLIFFSLAYGSPAYAGKKLQITAEASSTLKGKKGIDYEAENIIDGDRTSAWVEDKPDDGIGEWVKLEFDRSAEVAGIIIWPGDMKDTEEILEHNTPSLVVLSFDEGEPMKVALPARFQTYPAKEDPKKRGEQTYRPLTDSPENFNPRVILFSEVRNTKTLRIEIAQVYHSTKKQDTAISEVALITRDEDKLYGGSTRRSLLANALNDIASGYVESEGAADSGFTAPSTPPEEVPKWFAGLSEEARCQDVATLDRQLADLGTMKLAPYQVSTRLKTAFGYDMTYLAIDGAKPGDSGLEPSKPYALERSFGDLGESGCTYHFYGRLQMTAAKSHKKLTPSELSYRLVRIVTEE